MGVAKRAAQRDLMDLVNKGVLEKIGKTGKCTTYVLRKGAISEFPTTPSQEQHNAGPAGANASPSRRLEQPFVAEWKKQYLKNRNSGETTMSRFPLTFSVLPC